MSDFPGFAGFSGTVISNLDRKCGPWPTSFANSSAAWTTANLARYWPVLVQEPTIITKIAVRIGGTSSGNLDLGIYDEQGARLVSTGSVAMAAANAVQLEDVTDTLLAPGVYFIAMAVDNTTATFVNVNAAVSLFTAPSNAFVTLAGVREQASAFPLPATATFADPTSSYLVGINCTTRIPVT